MCYLAECRSTRRFGATRHPLRCSRHQVRHSIKCPAYPYRLRDEHLLVTIGSLEDHTFLHKLYDTQPNDSVLSSNEKWWLLASISFNNQTIGERGRWRGIAWDITAGATTTLTPDKWQIGNWLGFARLDFPVNSPTVIYHRYCSGLTNID